MMKIGRKELIKKYIEFFKSKGHKEIKNSSLVPENDPSVLFTTAGMHPLVPYLLGQPHPQGKRLVNIQRCIRTADINEVGDDFHLTFFEMLGNWSLGDYFKKESIEMSFEFLTEELGIKKEELEVSCFAGDKNAEKDSESAKIWESLGIKKQKIKFLPKEDNWWGPAGKTGPCGPDTEIFVNECEIWNNVFMQYIKDEKGNYNLAKQKNVDTGMGVERTLAILSGKKSVYETPCFSEIIKAIEKESGKKYKGNEREMRIIADHIKAACFILADSVVPSNVERGYVLRRLIRRAIVYGNKLGIKDITSIALPVFEIYDDYEHLQKNKEKILEEIKKEKEKFLKTLEQGTRIFEKLAEEKKAIDEKNAFLLFQSYGFPLEMTQEMAKERGIKVDVLSFNKAMEKHQELSRTASAGQFKSGLADNTEETTKYHTAAHLMLSALRKFVNPKIEQKGSNINAERIRFDFSFDRKLTEEEVKKIEDFVNEAIKNKIPVEHKELSLEEAKKQGALGSFESKYGEKVSVYKIGDLSNEICAGPHVKNTGELGKNNKKFKITEQESVGAGARRVKAMLV